MLLPWDTMGKCFSPILCQWDYLLISEHLWREFSPNFIARGTVLQTVPHPMLLGQTAKAGYRELNSEKSVSSWNPLEIWQTM